MEYTRRIVDALVDEVANLRADLTVAIFEHVLVLLGSSHWIQVRCMALYSILALTLLLQGCNSANGRRRPFRRRTGGG